jgi:endonuclease/exonuclease/phosphatase family metal-dependent hydrolase
MFFEISEPPAAAQTAEISVLTYNVKGLPWFAARGRGTALREIGRELARMRQAGRQPDVVLIQEGFRSEMTELAALSGYRFWVRGPSQDNGFGKLMSGGLHVLSDAPIVDVRAAAYRSCAGLDCVANKGVMLVRLAPDGGPEIDIVNTHLNSRRASLAPPARARAAHNRQTEQLIDFLKAERDAGVPLVVGGDFNVKSAPERYYHQALERPYTVVSEFCALPDSGCGAAAMDAAAEPWLMSQDLQAFAGEGGVKVRPVKVEALFAGHKARLSDHDGYLVRYELSWTSLGATTAANRPGVEVRPQFGARGEKVSYPR